MEISVENSYPVTSREKGDSLELAVEHIFKVARFTTERNVFVAKYEIDIKAQIGDRTIIVECKNYQNSNMVIRNLIHQWNSKNQIIKAHKIIIVITGLPVKEGDYVLASEFDIEIWTQDDISDLFNLSLKPEELRAKLLEKISLKPLTISERYRDYITYLVIKPLLTNLISSEESNYWYFNKWLRSHILTELQMININKEERLNHIKLFEGSKTKKGFLNIKIKRKQIDYWNTVQEQLANNIVLNVETQNRYLFYMNDLLSEYKSQKEFFVSGDYFLRTQKLIKSRLFNALYFDQECIFKIDSVQNTINVTPLNDGVFQIQISNITEAQGNVLNWILTSEYKPEFNDTTKTYQYTWFSNSLAETSDKVFRIFTEYFDLNENNAVQDIALK